MMTENSKKVVHPTHKMEWEEPQVVELDLNETESGLLPGAEAELLQTS